MAKVTKKRADLYDDEFYPDRAFRSFVRVPRGILEVPNSILSEGAKLLYGNLVGYAGEYGAAYPTKEELRDSMGGPSPRTLLRWQNELRDAGLIRVKVKGRWFPNNYYFLRSGYVGNGTPEENATIELVHEQKKMRRKRKIDLRQQAAEQRRAQRKAEAAEIWRKHGEWETQPENAKFLQELDKWHRAGKNGPIPTPPESLWVDVSVAQETPHQEQVAIQQPNEDLTHRSRIDLAGMKAKLTGDDRR